MSRYRVIDSEIWNDPEFQSLPFDVQFICFLLMTHPDLTELDIIASNLPFMDKDDFWEAYCLAKKWSDVSFGQDIPKCNA